MGKVVDVYDVITDVAKSVNSQFSFEVAIPGKGAVGSDVKTWVPTSSVLLNLLLGDEDYGVPSGRVIEVFGDFSHGKSTVMQHVMNAFQNAGGISNLIDSESGWDRPRALKMGHNHSRHLTIEVDTVESGFDVIYGLNAKYKEKFGDSVPIVYGWDTIAASPTDGEKQGDEYVSGMTFKARKIRSELRRLARELPKANATLVFVNQTIQRIKALPGQKKTTTPGGGGIKFWSSIRLEIRRVATIKSYLDKTKPVGIISVGKTVKNKLHPPLREADLPIAYAHGIDSIREVMSYLLDNTCVVNSAGAYLSIVGFKDKDIKFYGKDTPRAFMDNPTLLPWLQEQVIMHWCSEAS